MVGKVSERVLLREGLERTDNGMKQTSWPDVPPINQKNYYTDYMKRDDQILSLRLQNEVNRERLVQNAKDRDRAMNTTNGEVPLPVDDEDGPAPSSSYMDPSKIIVIHPGSQNLRIGFASDALPKTIPMTLATKYPQTESEMHDALPRRQFEGRTMDQQHGEEWSKKYQKMCNDLKIDMRANKRKVLPNSKDLVVNFNRRIEPEIISQHNDPLQIDWTDVKAPQDSETGSKVFIGQQALRVPDDSNPKFKLWWPIQHGWLNEDDYDTRAHLFNDLEMLLDRTFRWELGLKRKADWKQYSCVIIIPDLYDKRYVELLLHLCIELYGFGRVSFIQESIAATFGAGYTQACVVDVGAQKTSISCVEDGLCIEDSRINLKFGGYDVTETFIKMMLYDNFPYQEINLRRRYDFLLAEELKIKYCTLSQANISVQNFDFHLRAPNQPTRKYQFKFYDEVILAPMGLYDPSIFDNSAKLRGRRKLIDRSYNAYDVELPDDPSSAAQLAILALIQPSVTQTTIPNTAGAPADMATPSKERTQPFNFLSRPGDHPIPAPYVFGSRDLNGSPAPAAATAEPRPRPTAPPSCQAHPSTTPPPPNNPQQRTAKSLAIERDSVLPLAPLDIAIMTSIQNAAKGDDKKVRELLGSIMVIGGGAKTPHFAPFLEEKLKLRRPDLADRILKAYADYAGKELTWSPEKIAAFSRDVQKDLDVETALVLSDGKPWDINAFLKYMTSSLTQPQYLSSESSAEAYKNVLLRGCRCIEIDLKKISSAREPRVLHGYTLTKEVSFREVCLAIRDYGFVVSDTPLIVSLEVHCSPAQQETMVAIMQETWADRLLPDPKEDAAHLPSPAELAGKILVKVKYAPPTGGSASTPTGTDADAEEAVVAAAAAPAGAPAAKKPSKPSKIIQALSKLGIYTRGVTFKSLVQPEASMPTHIFSLSENGVMEVHEKSARKLFEHNRRFLMRAYPSGLRIRSSNLDPAVFWRKGIQIVALNWQNWDEGMMLNEGMFAGTSGRPQALAVRHFTMDLTITVLAAQSLPLPPGDSSASGFRPYLKVEVHVEEPGERHGTDPSARRPREGGRVQGQDQVP
ncbi:actin-like protein arp8 [Collariella sp. IMI 366227]|nr:actin-like protein arp8 [Collariella sp. IMI 366227]